ncbi:hypothetical protein COCCADRAFT_110975 [Bipolaris zeicola 26-R-13]|uniref:Uncharacterized protein n=1 Tax=Cochliobolus carbonum (strain 26-R-13) TaxID=930089 RepID=W6XQ68_COCC2|nr:uncharacterized protein COCCADRAFT_110975 [Bipolaris zeicola 26-R-13]EUC27708.1 hypothetical protein COCCADRAFT_110975 [Bipolaris zeicola 26-R-13]
MKILSIAIISKLAVIVTAADCGCTPTTNDLAMKYGPPNNNCAFLSGHPQDKYYCVRISFQ